MIETIQIPLLLKAIDFVFEEGRKILEERRERRKMEAQAQSPAASVPEAAPAAAAEPPPAEVQQKDEVKQDLLNSRKSSTWCDCWKHIPATTTLPASSTQNGAAPSYLPLLFTI
jgi:hypothetical protein